MTAKRINHPHLAIDGICGAAGELHAHFHCSDPRDGLTFQCPMIVGSSPPCGHVFTIAWDELDALNEPRLERDPDESIHLPPCPKCGAVTVFNHNDVEYGQDLPEHHTMRMLREHVCCRPAFSGLACFAASQRDGSHQGRDFSHLPAKERPAHHCKVDVAAELAALRGRAEYPESV